MLHARQVPSVGGDTLFASQYKAYDDLSDAMKVFLEPLDAEHDGRVFDLNLIRQPSTHPLIFAVHPDWKPRLRDAEPDLWSVRSLVLDIPGNEGKPGTNRPAVSVGASKAKHDADYVTSVEVAQAALDRLVEMPSPDANSLARLHMYMASAPLAADRASDAAGHADKALASATSRNTRLRAQVLAVAARAKLEAANDVVAALQHLQEAVGVWRSILNSAGETPQTLRDLSISLDSLGWHPRNGSETDAARAAYEEALTIDRRMIETTGETLQTLRDLSVALDRIGRIREAAGETDA